MEPNTNAEMNLPNRRHRRGTACDECRRRKLRCDGQQPQCRICLDAGVACEITQRKTRGPKKGHLRQLKDRLVTLEAMLESPAVSETRHDPSLFQFMRSESASDDSPAAPPLQTPAVTSISDHELLPPGFTPNVPSLSEGSSLEPFGSSPDTQIPLITSLIHDELDQLYLDRVHHSIPILHQGRYLSWSKSSTKTASRQCLQYAMWTVAALLSAQFRDMIDPLYQATKRMLEHLTVDGGEDDNIETELPQAWVLVVIFESMRTYHRRAWMSTGRAFRLVQAAHYHEIDSPDNKRGDSYAQGDFIEVEEKRRVFWMAYLLDHILSMRDDWPITLNEHVICTRLPASDLQFQNGYQEIGPFLSDAMTDSTLKVRSSFNECLIFATICGRSLLHSQQYQISKAYGEISLDCTQYRRGLENLLLSRLQLLSQIYPIPTQSNDPLLLFTHILAQATIIYHYKTMTKSTEPANSPESSEFTYQQRALEASQAMIRIARALQTLPFTKVHPLMPMPLFVCADFLYGHMQTELSVEVPIQELFHIFRKLKNVNDPEQSYLSLLPRSCISKTAELAGLGSDASTF
ncbi:fungal-specific transcription factor domain-containing protein [Aspergillus californicus]